MAAAAVSIALGASVAAAAFYLTRLFLGREPLGKGSESAKLASADDGESGGEESRRAPTH